MKRPVDLILSDVDGTLIPFMGQISPYTSKIIHAAIDSGIKFALVTGRTKAGSQIILDQIGLKNEEICGAYQNGTHMECFGKVVYTANVTLEDIKAVSSLVHTTEATATLFCGNEWYIEKRNHHYDEVKQFYQREGIVAPFESVLGQIDPCSPRKLVIRGLPETIDSLLPVLTQKFTSIDFFRSNVHILECTLKGNSKGTAVDVFSKELRIPVQRMAAFGDFDNDIPMLSKVGYGVAMGAVQPQVAACCAYQCGLAELDGFAHFVEEHFLG